MNNLHKLLLAISFYCVGSLAYGAEINLKSGEVITLRGDTVTCEADASSQQPTTTTRCVRRNGVGSCTENETTFHFRGVSCTEDCDRRNGIGECTYRNDCTYQGNGCFIKKTCLRRDGVGQCREENEEAICG